MSFQQTLVNLALSHTILDNYDYIIAGAGCAGLSMAWRILHASGLQNKRVLLVDREAKNTNDRTWSFWYEGPSEWDSIIDHRWEEMGFYGPDGYAIEKLKKYTYQQISSQDYYRLIHQQLDASGRFTRCIGNVEQVGTEGEQAYIILEGEKIYADYIFDSRFLPNRSSFQKGGHTYLLQHFKGWIIETQSLAFDAKQATLMDFRAPQNGYAGFFYVLPYSSRKALVEYTLFSPRVLDQADYDRALEQYITTELGIGQFRIQDQEFGVIPMTDAPLPESSSPRIIHFGSRGGAIKPTTGYAFLNIQKQTKQLIHQLEIGAQPSVQLQKSRRFLFYDRLLLHILSREGHVAQKIFSRLFLGNKMERILTFLSERTSLVHEAGIFASLPVLPFLRAIPAVYFPSLRNWLTRKKKAKVEAKPFGAIKAGRQINRA